MLTALLLVLLLPQQSASCATLEVCRAEALIAHASQDYERFHDLAWAAYRKGKSNDPALMLLVARAQSLSGRPGDALVMLERVVALGGTTDAATSEDFARVRALARWKDVASTFGSDSPPAATAPETPAAAAPVAKPPAATPTAPAAPPVVKEPAPAPAPAPKPSGAPLKFTTVLTPTALAYDGVSKRFVIADRAARRVAVIDETSGQVSTLVGAGGALGDVGGIAIDSQQGDLWVVTSESEGVTLHKIQLISGRVLSKTAVKGLQEPVAAVTFVRGSGLIVADASGIFWRVRASGATEKLGALEYVPRALASDGDGRLIVSAGGPRLGRYALSPAGIRRVGTIEVERDLLGDAPFAISGSRLLLVARDGGEFEIRSISVK